MLNYMIDIKRLTFLMVAGINSLTEHFIFGIQIKLFAISEYTKVDLFDFLYRVAREPMANVDMKNT